MDMKVPEVDLGLMEGGDFVTSLRVSRMEERLARMSSPCMLTSQ